MISKMKCLIGHHSPDRARVWNDGVNFRSSCKGCRRSMIRDVHAGWRLFDSERDLSLNRCVKP